MPPTSPGGKATEQIDYVPPFTHLANLLGQPELTYSMAPAA